MVTCRSTSHCHSVQECRGLSVFLLVVAFLFVWDRFFFQLHKNCNLASHPRVSCVDIRRCWSFLRNVLQCMRWVPDACIAEHYARTTNNDECPRTTRGGATRGCNSYEVGRKIDPIRTKTPQRAGKQTIHGTPVRNGSVMCSYTSPSCMVNGDG